MSTYDFEPDPDDYGPEPAHIANPRKALIDATEKLRLIALLGRTHELISM